MKVKQTNAEGVEEEVEVMTPAEVEAKLATEKAVLEEQHKSTIDTLSKEKQELEDKIKKAQLEGIKDDHPNFKILKEALDKKDGDIKALKTEIDEDKKVRKNEAMENAIKTASKGNEEMEKKVRLHLKETLATLPEDTVEQRQTKLIAALKLSADQNDSPGMFDNGAGGGGFGGGNIDKVGGVEFTAREKALGEKLGITAEDYKKYGPKLGKK
jgi:hypothetical protein